MVQVYDFDTKQVSEIPEAELAPGMVLANVEGVGRVWIKASSVVGSGIYRHDADSFEPVMGLITSIRDKLNEVFPMTLKQWVDGFRKDMNPEQEIARWGHAAKVYEQCVKEFNFIAAQRKELFREVLTNCLSCPPENVLTLASLDRITKEQAQRAIGLYFHWNKHIGEK